jgi:hypothetical protein
MKWMLAVIFLWPCVALAQLPIPITPDWLKGGEKQAGVLHSTQVQLFGDNYRVLQTNVVAKSGGFKLLGIITIKSPSYVQAVSRLYAKAGVEEGRPQTLANVVYETGGLNVILFSLPKIRVRADLVEFTDARDNGAKEAAVTVRRKLEEPERRVREVEQTDAVGTRDPEALDKAQLQESLRRRLRE